MRQVAIIKHKKSNFFITNHEAFVLWKEAAYYPKLQIMLGLSLFRGLRIGETRAINIRDFKNAEFTKMDVILQKSNILDEFPIMKEFALLLKNYIQNNLHTFINGYLFPKYRKFGGDPYMERDTANTMFFKFRRKITQLKNPDGSIKYPWANEKGDYYDPDTGKAYYNRHRIGWHSCRRWFETTLWEKGYSEVQIAHIMRYSKVETVYTYLDCYKTWKKEQEILQDTFGDLFKECIGFQENQTSLCTFINKTSLSH